jgi:hypothetical protein
MEARGIPTAYRWKAWKKFDDILIPLNPCTGQSNQKANVPSAYKKNAG